MGASWDAPWGALVGGGSSGIGLACAARLIEAGAEVTIAGREEAEVAGAAKTLASGGRQPRAIAGDLSDPDHARAVVEEASSAAPLRVLVNSAGIQRYGTVETTDVELWDEVMAVNVKIAFLLSKFAVPKLRAGGGGSIVTVASVQAVATQSGVAAYATSKAALVGLTRSMAVDHAGENIRANVVFPGSVDTPMLRWAAERFAPPGQADELVQSWGKMHPMDRVARPEEVAEAVYFLASPQASFITGADLRIDGGLLSAIGLPTDE